MSSGVLDVVIAAIADEALGIRSFRLVGASGAALPAAPPGAHVDVHLPNGLVRQYSLCHDPAETDAYRIAVKREPASRGGSLWLHEAATVGSRLRLGAPRSLLAAVPGAPRHVLLAGGIGVTPLLSLALHFARIGAPFEMHYFARSEAHAAFAAALTAGALKPHVHLHLGLEGAALTAALDDILATHTDAAQLYLCGPSPFMALARERAAPTWSAEAIHVEHFTPAATPAGAASDGFDVTLARCGATVHVPAGRSILDVLLAHGHAVEHSCEQGFCGTCMTAVLAGEPEHRDSFLTPEEIASGRWIMPCVSRARGVRLVLDL